MGRRGEQDSTAPQEVWEGTMLSPTPLTPSALTPSQGWGVTWVLSPQLWQQLLGSTVLFKPPWKLAEMAEATLAEEFCSA